MSYSYYVVVTNRKDGVKEVLELHDKRGMSERRIAQFTNEFLFHLPMERFMSNWVYLLCAQLAYNLSLWIRDLVLPPFYRKKHIKRIRRTIGLIASKVTHGGHQVRMQDLGTSSVVAGLCLWVAEDSRVEGCHGSWIGGQSFALGSVRGSKRRAAKAEVSLHHGLSSLLL